MNRQARIRREMKQTTEYKMGYQHALVAISDHHGYRNLTPSIKDREVYGYAWKLFMAGWKDACHRRE